MEGNGKEGNKKARYNSFKTQPAGDFCRSNSMQLNATQCNFCRTEVATSWDFIAILVQFVSLNVSTRLLLKQKLCAC